MTSRQNKIITGIIMTIWIVSFFIVLKFEIDSTREVKSYKEQLETLTKEKEYWKNRYVRTLEGDFDWQITSQLGIKGTDIEFLEIKRDFKGLLTIRTEEGEKDYRFQLVFGRDDKPWVTDLAPRE